MGPVHTLIGLDGSPRCSESSLGTKSNYWLCNKHAYCQTTEMYTVQGHYNIIFGVHKMDSVISFCFDLTLRPINNLSVKQGQVFLG